MTRVCKRSTTLNVHSISTKRPLPTAPLTPRVTSPSTRPAINWSLLSRAHRPLTLVSLRFGMSQRMVASHLISPRSELPRAVSFLSPSPTSTEGTPSSLLTPASVSIFSISRPSRTPKIRGTKRRPRAPPMRLMDKALPAGRASAPRPVAST